VFLTQLPLVRVEHQLVEQVLHPASMAQTHPYLRLLLQLVAVAVVKADWLV
jgi:hypothetical protein